MDPAIVASQVAVVLAPFLGGLAAAGQRGLAEAGEAIGEQVSDWARGVWGRLVAAARGPNSSTGQPGPSRGGDEHAGSQPAPAAASSPLEQTAAAVVANPNDKVALSALEFQIRLLLQANPELNERVAGSIESAPKEVRTVIASGERAAAVGGDNFGSINTGEITRG